MGHIFENKKVHTIIYKIVVRICTLFNYLCTPFRKYPIIYKIATIKYLCTLIFNFHYFDWFLRDPKHIYIDVGSNKKYFKI